MANPFRVSYVPRWLVGRVSRDDLLRRPSAGHDEQQPNEDPVVVSTTRYGDFHEMQLQRLVPLTVRRAFSALCPSALEAGDALDDVVRSWDGWRRGSRRDG